MGIRSGLGMEAIFSCAEVVIGRKFGVLVCPGLSEDPAAVILGCAD